MIGATGAEVEVDTETGEFKVTRLVNLVDVGKPINPAIVETQISGATVMQLGFTLQEQMQFNNGQVINASLADYKIPGIRDIPPMENEAVDAEQRNGPFGAKGVGESGTFGVSPAIANAIDDFYANNREQEFTPNILAEKKRFSWDKFVEGIESLYRVIRPGKE